MDRRGHSPGRISTYGLACMQCFKAKCRCVPRSNGPCERCHRLRKDCQPSESARRRNAQKSQQSQESDARIAQLEGKVDILMSMLQATASSSSGSSPVDINRFITGGHDTSNSTTSGSTLQGPTPPTESFPTSSSDIPPKQAEECLEFFRTRMLPHFPFFNIPPDLTSWQLRVKRPVLFQAIVVVTTHSTQKKLSRAEDFKRLVFTSALVEVQSSIDLLLGILTYIAWSTDAFLGRANLLSRMMMLAISLVCDLRLFKPSSPDVQLIIRLTQGYSEGDEEAASAASGGTLQSFLEQQKVVLACFVLSSNISSHFGRIDALRWTPQMEEALRILERNMSCLADEAFIFQVRLQLLTQRAAHIREQHEADRARIETAAATMPIPSYLYLKSLQKQLQDFRDALSQKLRQEDILITYGQYVELYIEQASRSVNPDTSLLNTATGQNIDNGTLVPGYERIGSLWKSVESVKTWLEAFHRIPPSDCIGLPFHFWSQVIRCTAILKYLSTLDDPAWDCQLVRKAVNIISALEWIPKKLDETSKEAGLQFDDDLFKLLSKLLRRSREWVAAKWNISSEMRPETDDVQVVVPPAPNAGVDASASSVIIDMPDLDGIPWIQSMDLESDKWFEDVLGRRVGVARYTPSTTATLASLRGIGRVTFRGTTPRTARPTIWVSATRLLSRCSTNSLRDFHRNSTSNIEELYKSLAEQQPALSGAQIVPTIQPRKGPGVRSRYYIFDSHLHDQTEDIRQPPPDYLVSRPMKFFYQVLSTPTADSPGSTIVLNYPNRRYVFGHLAEGTQRVFIEHGFPFSYLNDMFVTGKTTWHNYGGTLGMILTLADSRTSGLKGLEEGDTKTSKVEAALSRLTIHGGRNVSHMLATARRFIFRKALPISVKEYDSTSLARDQRGNSNDKDPFQKPTFVDENIRVWAMALKPSYEIRHFESRAGFRSPRKRSLNEFEERDSEQSTASDARDKDQLLREHIVKDMFDSDWKLDALYEENLYDVKLPATMFVRNPETKDLERYQGPLPGSSGIVPNIKVLVRRPWPAATLDRLPPTTPSSESLCYFVRNHDQRGAFDPKKAIELGVPRGPAFSQLTKGLSYTTEDGTVVTPDMVLGPTRPGRTVAFIDLPSTLYIDDLISRPEWKSPTLTETLSSVFWILGPGVAEDSRLLDFISGLKGCEHVVSSTDVCPNRLTMMAAAKSSLRLAKINSENFAIPYHDNVTVPQPGTRPNGHNSNASTTQKPDWTVSCPGLLLDMEPNFGINESELIPQLDTRDVVTRIPKAVQQRLNVIRRRLTNHEVVRQVMDLRKELPPLAMESEVVTLGTGSSSPSKHRNVSATLLKVVGKGYYLLDCGENTLGQLKRTYPPEQFREVMQNLRMIWISHMHADHHLGSVAVIKEWYEVNYGARSPSTGSAPEDVTEVLKQKRLAVVGETMYIQYLEEYAGVENFGFEKILPLAVLPPAIEKPYTSLVYRYTQPDGTTQEDGRNPVFLRFDTPKSHLTPLLQATTGLVSLNAVFVNHCRHAMGLSLEWEDGFKVSYSGDCRPSMNFAQMGRDSTLLIHEATFQDDLQGQALAKKHSTTSEAMMVGRWMNAKLVLLTHFSQRYAKISKMEDSSRRPRAQHDNPRATFKMQKGTLDIPDDDPPEDGADDEVTQALESDFDRPEMPVCMAFDYMGVKLRDIPIAQMFMPAFEKLIERLDRVAEEESAVTREKARMALEAKQARTGKKKSGVKSPQRLSSRSFSTEAKKSAWSASESESGWSDEGEGEPEQKDTKA
ncbi:tRNA processing endoribonuclease Trz1, putative [Talaromyces stipitatus ATCC 10500]|uniref:ribonuclease Z n=1 Tax=Talaromyces stipitatus (strain ATCC 10500 / CBS 375.48 / QM 6759 / NRRL 1006) TaxID=441959 RepID=B8M0P9_TALSN|nr:tRNA processing endoribonuclease Trz1, putative [Talaromyces stipitatus ATCC 10500]EED21432.1 tRNA processing endoribonuclease Trz1, putative [Talaromyces stipitatus ATCC 10500]